MSIIFTKKPIKSYRLTHVSLRKSGGEWDCCTLKPLNFDPSCSCLGSWRWVQTLVTTKRPRSSQREPQTIGWEFNELDAPFLWECLLAASLPAVQIVQSTNGDDQMCLDRRGPSVCFLPDSNKVHEGSRRWWFKWRRNYYWRTMESSTRWVNRPIKMLPFSLQLWKMFCFF